LCYGNTSFVIRYMSKTNTATEIWETVAWEAGWYTINYWFLLVSCNLNARTCNVSTVDINYVIPYQTIFCKVIQIHNTVSCQTYLEIFPIYFIWNYNFFKKLSRFNSCPIFIKKNSTKAELNAVLLYNFNTIL
jgi:hypothetical protein